MQGRKISRTQSSIIQAFTAVNQYLDLEVEKERYTQLLELTSRRRVERERRYPPKKKKKKEKASGIADAIRSAEGYKTMEEHFIPLPDLYQRLHANPDTGLSTEDANRKNKQLGDNVLSEKKKTPWYIKLSKCMIEGFSLLLWIAAALCFVGWALNTSDPSNAYLGGALIVVIIITGVQMYYQEAKSAMIMESFKNFIPAKAKVLRDGHYTQIDATKIVPGDIIEIIAGNRIPADIRIIYSQEMKVDNSSLTGESDPLLRSVECTHRDNPLETANLAFFGTLCKEGVAKGVVINIGDKTVIGQIANLASAAEQTLSPLRKEMNRFIKIIAIISISTGAILFLAGFMIGYPATTNIIFAIGVLAAYVPEGLVTCVVIALTLAAKRLARKKVLVKNLEAVETLGSTSCICSDKTGTLTQNRMTLEHLWYEGRVFKADNRQLRGPNFNYEYDLQSLGFKNLHENAILSSEAVFDNAVPAAEVERISNLANATEREEEMNRAMRENEARIRVMTISERPVIGDASESAIVRFFQPIEDIISTRGRYPIVKMEDGSFGRIPFNSAWKFALAICEYKTADSDYCVFMKGAPEKIWAISTRVLVDGSEEQIDGSWRKKFDEVNLAFGEGGERVLGFAKFHLPREKFPLGFQFNCKNPLETNFPMKKYTFTGLVSLIDPPREAVPYAILKCRAAGIKVIMVTGDQPVTAAAIAKQVNIFGKNERTVNQVMESERISLDEALHKADALVIHGDLITKAVAEDELLPEKDRGRTMAKWLNKPRIVFARTTPAQKLIIVKACQAQGHVVAVTGDGVNDSPAIKKADIGSAMGITGSDVAKDAADMILLTDDFAAIVIGVEEGRKIFDNLKRAIVYCLASNIAELLPFLALILLGFPLPLSTVLILCIDLGFNIVPSITFASEEAEIDIMVRPPRKKHEHLVTARLLTNAYLFYGVLESAGLFLTYFLVMYDFGFRTGDLFRLAIDNGFRPTGHAIYDPALPYNGMDSPKFIQYCNDCWNGVGPCDPQSLASSLTDGPPDWLFTSDKATDLRLYYLQCSSDGGFASRVSWEACTVRLLSQYSQLPVCYNTEALKWAQTAAYLSVALEQYTLMFVVKTRGLSFMYGGLRNYQLIFGMAWILMFTMTIVYFPVINNAFSTRPVIFLQYGIPGVPFVILILVLDEVRKYLIRHWKKPINKPNWWYRNTKW